MYKLLIQWHHFNCFIGTADLRLRLKFLLLFHLIYSFLLERALYCEIHQDLHLHSTQVKYVAAQGSKVPENGGTGLHTGRLRISVSHRVKTLFAFFSLRLNDILPLTDTVLKYSHFTEFLQSSHITEMIHQASMSEHGIT